MVDLHGRSPVAHMLKLSQPSFDVENASKLALAAIGVLTFLYGVVRFICRPLFDDHVLAAWKRKGADVERHLRDVTFRTDLAKRDALASEVQRAISLAAANASAIAAQQQDTMRIFGQLDSATRLLAGIPTLVVSLDNMCERIDEMHLMLQRTNEIGIANGQTLAAHSVLLGDKRVHVRREADLAPMPRLDDGEGQ